MLQSMGSQRVRHDLATEQQQQVFTGSSYDPGQVSQQSESHWVAQSRTLRPKVIIIPNCDSMFMAPKGIFGSSIVPG